jgi:hypothetical protein
MTYQIGTRLVWGGRPSSTDNSFSVACEKLAAASTAQPSFSSFSPHDKTRRLYDTIMKSFLLAAASALLFSTTAFAQPAAQSGPRLSAGVGQIVGFRIEGPNESGDGGLGLYLRGGVQLSELFGIGDDLAGAVGIIPLVGFSVLVRDSVDLTVTPADWLTLAAVRRTAGASRSLRPRSEERCESISISRTSARQAARAARGRWDSPAISPTSSNATARTAVLRGVCS